MDGLGLSHTPLRIGLTGGIGSGKSTVASLLSSSDSLIVDTDAIARRITGAGGLALPAIAAAFGNDLLNAEGLDRVRMRQLVFEDGSARERLEALLHPLIRQQAAAQVLAAGPAALWVFDVPLLVESRNWRQQVDRVLLIDCDVEVQRRRVLQRPGWRTEQFEGVLRAQASRQQRRQAADAVIDNSHLTLQALRLELQALLQNWQIAMKELPP